MVESLLNKVAGLSISLQLNQKKTTTQGFSCEIYKLFKNNFFEEHLRTAAFGSYSYQWCISDTVKHLWRSFLRIVKHEKLLTILSESSITDNWENPIYNCLLLVLISKILNSLSFSSVKMISSIPSNCCRILENLNLLMHNVPKWSDTL